jgi:hypothetical protein
MNNILLPVLLAYAVSGAIAGIASAQTPDPDWQAPKIGLAAAKTPTAQPWTLPAEFGKVRAGGEPGYDTLDLAFELSRQYRQATRFQRFAIAPYWQYSEREKKPVNDRGVTLSYAILPRSDGADSSVNAMEVNWLASLTAGRTKTELQTSKTYADANQTTLKLQALFKSNGWATRYYYPTLTVGAFSDRRDKPNPLVPNGREDGLFVRPEMTLYPFTLYKKGDPGSLEITAAAQYQHGVHASGMRAGGDHSWFKLQAVLPLGSIGEGEEKWQPALALQRTGGEDATQTEPRKFQTKLTFQLKYGK